MTLVYIAIGWTALSFAAGAVIAVLGARMRNCEDEAIAAHRRQLDALAPTPVRTSR